MSYVKPDDTTSWNVERIVSYGAFNANDIAWDGRFVIISSNTQLCLIPFELFDRSHMDEVSLIAGAVGTPRAEEFLSKINQQQYITTLGGYWLAPFGDGVYVTNTKDTFSIIKFYNIATQDVSTIAAPAQMNSNLLCCNGKLWMTQSNRGGDILHVYDIQLGTWSSSTIPVREQQELRHLSHDKNNHVLITNFNDWSVCKYTVDGTYIEKVHLDDGGRNKEPTFVFTNNTGQTFIASFNGMISTFDTTTNAISHFAYNGKSTHIYQEDFWGFDGDDSYLWISTNNNVLNRLKLSDQTIVGTEFGDPPVMPALTYEVNDFAISINTTPPTTDTVMESGYHLNKTWAPSTWKKLIVVPGMTKQVWDGDSLQTVTYQSHVCVLHSNGVFAFPNTNLWRENFAEIGATAMISSGPYDYTGD